MTRPTTCLIAASLAWAFSPATARAQDAGAAQPDIVALVGAVREADLRRHVERLAGAADAPTRAGPRRIRSRSDYHPDIRVAEDYLAETLEALGLEVRRIPFAFDGPVALANVEATLRGTERPAEVYLLAAHYDSTARAERGWDRTRDPAPGADDNASGCALVLEAARVLSAGRVRATVRFVLFAGEEEGLAGSDAYAEAARGSSDDLRAVISMDPVGNTGALRDHLFFTYDAASIEEARRMEEIGPRYGIAVPILAVPGDSPTVPDARSDHYSFWRRGYRGLHGGSLPGDFYHTTGDTPERVDYGFLTEATRAVVARLAEAARYFVPPPRPGSGGCSCATPTGASGALGWVLFTALFAVFRRRGR